MIGITEEVYTKVMQEVCNHEFTGFHKTACVDTYLDVCSKCGKQEEYEKDYS